MWSSRPSTTPYVVPAYDSLSGVSLARAALPTSFQDDSARSAEAGDAATPTSRAAPVSTPIEARSPVELNRGLFLFQSIADLIPDVADLPQGR